MTDSSQIAPLLVAARPRALAALLRYFHDLERAEDAFQEACLRALQRWPGDGVPRDPLAWLILVARNAALDRVRREARETPLTDETAPPDQPSDTAESLDHLDRARYGDEVLHLLFIACHPALPAPSRIALALRVVSGLTLAQIASAFLIAERTVEQRIVRARQRIAALGLPFETPDAAAREARLSAVSATIYLLFNEGYAASGGERMLRTSLCEEAIRLAQLLTDLFPAHDETLGLLALLQLQHARHAARIDAQGEVVLLEDQDRSAWDRAAINAGLAALARAQTGAAPPGPYRLQAEIAAVHARAASAADTDWAAIDRCYAALEAVRPSPVVTLNRAVAVEKLHGAASALALIAPLDTRLAGYFHFHGVRGALLARLARHDEASAAFAQALALARTPAEARHIQRQIAHLATSTSPTRD
ncbi:hypothetical protein GCM10007860_15800 [Chitiniphilus shinanonensis]|uniref:RNA polymerase ECF-type sigma factor n=1 Tax=Chitiniphilus shinanonensis TaxID=553088 RepID=F8WST6_9NEIS|nr:sigma-70 family RNA polymerase sigma factor [Chitiniphilus shinanonensis]BAK53923.1 RNA polymerase ECF-type sigma factor [Chitiniphilus shinanonensis]GLS04433.1 hypothetical protein GCM10007860_15800 [Chitiniphilus shinanonensis]